MYRFAVENIYIIIEAVQQIEVQGLDCVCKQFDYERKISFHNEVFKVVIKRLSFGISVFFHPGPMKTKYLYEVKGYGY